MCGQDLVEHSCRSAAQYFAAPAAEIEGGLLRSRLLFAHDGQAGVYPVRVFVTVGDSQVLAANPMVWVR